MTVYITKKPNGKYKYLAEWTVKGNGYSQFFTTLKDLKEYTAEWGAKYIKTNFEGGKTNE